MSSALLVHARHVIKMITTDQKINTSTQSSTQSSVHSSENETSSSEEKKRFFARGFGRTRILPEVRWRGLQTHGSQNGN
jgi:hypothetical protein